MKTLTQTKKEELAQTLKTEIADLQKFVNWLDDTTSPMLKEEYTNKLNEKQKALNNLLPTIKK